jgi:hypothetical protein
MIPDKALDLLPLWAVLVGTILVALLAVEMGYRLGRSWQTRTHEEKEGSVGAMAAATLGLLAFLLAFMAGLAAERFDNRRALVIEEANAIGTAWLRAGFLDEPERSRSRELLGEYVDTRLAAADDSTQIEAAQKRSEQIQVELWTTAQVLATEHRDSTIAALYFEALNNLIDIHTTRVMAVLTSRIPADIWAGIYIVALLSMVLLGVQTSYGGRRNWMSVIVLALVFAVVLTLIVDLDRPMQGMFMVNQQALIDLQAQIRAFSP